MPERCLLAEEAEKKTGLLGMILRKQTSEEKANAKVESLFQKCALTDKTRVFFGGARMNASGNVPFRQQRLKSK